MSVRAKFRCHSTTAYDPAHGYAGTGVVLHAVYGNGSDNAAWSKATPQGKVELTITVPGQEYWLDFTPVAADVPDSEPDDFADHDPATGDAPDLHVGYESAYPDEIQVGDVIDPVPEAGHDGPQYVTALTQHPDGTALDLRPATPEEIAAQLSTGTYTSDGVAPAPEAFPQPSPQPSRPRQPDPTPEAA